MTDTPTRFSLRDLPLPAKLVVTCFLLFVGLGYFSAMVQLHMQHSSKNGEPMPSPGDVVEIFAGWKKATDADLGPPQSKLQKLILGPLDAPWNGSGSMSAAFFHKDGADYRELAKEGPEEKKKLDAERQGEQLAVNAWLDSPVEDMRKAYAADAFARPAALKDQPVTAAYVEGDNLKVKSIIADRCARCHGPDGAQANFPLVKFEDILKYAGKPKVEVVNGMIRSDRQVGIEKLTQSTHAHLLSFAMLFSLTGLAFAFTTYPVWVRCLIAPMVVTAQVADVACWWLARVDGIGPSFALAILGTGTVVGLGLLLHIFGTIWNMFTGQGRVLVVLLIGVGAGGFGVLWTKAIQPGLDAEKAAVAARTEK